MILESLALTVTMILLDSTLEDTNHLSSSLFQSLTHLNPWQQHEHEDAY
jgi:hypothetical protein